MLWEDKLKKNILLDLFFTMLKISLFTFGGGYAMIALLQEEFITKRGWMEKEEFMDMVVISDSTPGPIAINTATYIGYKIAKFKGALVATFGMVLPSFVIIYLISLFFDTFLSIKIVASAFKGIQIGVIYLIFSAGVKLFKGIKKTAFSYVVFTITLGTILVLSAFSKNLTTITYLLTSGVIGIVFYYVSRLKNGGGSK